MLQLWKRTRPLTRVVAGVVVAGVAATAVWWRLVSLPLFSTMTRAEVDAVVDGVRAVCRAHRVVRAKALSA